MYFICIYQSKSFFKTLKIQLGTSRYFLDIKQKPIPSENRLKFDQTIFQYLNPPPCQLQIVDCELQIEDVELIYLNNIT
jgi:hypothetical protein